MPTATLPHMSTYRKRPRTLYRSCQQRPPTFHCHHRQQHHHLLLLALLVAFQSCLAGLAVCSNGGCCHAQEVESACAAAHAECESERSHDHPIFVDVDESHPCECIDTEIEAGDAIPGKRSQLLTLAPSPILPSGPEIELRFLIPRSVETRFPLARGDTSQSQRLAVLRATRLLL